MPNNGSLKQFQWDSNYEFVTIQQVIDVQDFIIVYQDDLYPVVFHSSQPLEAVYSNRISKCKPIWYKTITNIQLLAMYKNLKQHICDQCQRNHNEISFSDMKSNSAVLSKSLQQQKQQTKLTQSEPLDSKHIQQIMDIQYNTDQWIGPISISNSDIQTMKIGQFLSTEGSVLTKTDPNDYFIYHSDQMLEFMYSRITTKPFYYQNINVGSLLGHYQSLLETFDNPLSQSGDDLLKNNQQFKKFTRKSATYLKCTIERATSLKGLFIVSFDQQNNHYVFHGSESYKTLYNTILQSQDVYVKQINDLYLLEMYKILKEDLQKLSEQLLEQDKQIFNHQLIEREQFENDIRKLNIDYQRNKLDQHTARKQGDYKFELEEMQQRVNTAIGVAPPNGYYPISHQQLMVCYQFFLKLILQNYQDFIQELILNRQSEIHKFQSSLKPSPDQRFSCVGYCKIACGLMYVADCQHQYHIICFKQLIRFQLDQRHPQIKCLCGQKLSNKSFNVFDDEYQIDNNIKQFNMKRILIQRLYENQLQAISEKYDKQFRICSKLSCKQIYWGQTNDKQDFVCGFCKISK